MNYWLLKTEPNSYSIEDLCKEKSTPWDGVRNYQARNFLKNMSAGDLVFIYHSSIAAPSIVGLGEVVGESSPDPNQFDSKSIYFDAGSKKNNPRWVTRKILFKKKYKNSLTLTEIKRHPKLKNMLVAKQGGRLSVMPVENKEAEILLEVCF